MRIISTSIFILFSLAVFAGGNVFQSKSSLEKTFYNNKWMPDKNYQAELRELPAWQNFLQRNGDWWVMFNEESRKPHRAYGKPILVAGATMEDKARNFIQNELSGFNIPMHELELMGVAGNEKHQFVHFSQRHQGLKILESKLTVKLTNDGRVIMFGTDIFSDIQLDLNSSIGNGGAINYAQTGITESVVSVVANPELFILPVPENKAYVYKLVHMVNVHTIDNDLVPSDMLTLVDAHTGEILYRQNRVMHFDHKHKPPTGIDVATQGVAYPTNSYNGSATLTMPNMDFTIASSPFITDAAGVISTGVPGPQPATFFLRGAWCNVRVNNVTPSFNTTLIDGTNVVDFTAGTIQDRSAFYHVNVVHDHCKQVLPAFTGMDFMLPTNVDLTTGNCNAFYNGTSINFYALANGCTSFATVADVVYHEYGHGINDNFYSSLGSSFNNGAMNEGYADFWAYSITINPVVGFGTSTTDANSYIRRYDMNRKVYPVNLIGQVHADGEIIAGAWWDTFLNLGSDMNQTIDLFADAFPGLQASALNGNEGKAFTDVLIDVLQADDNDADLTNGTPNGMAIVDAFALHGITLISNAKLNHTTFGFHDAAEDIAINANLILNFPYTDYLSAVKCFYKINTGTWNSGNMSNVSGNLYTYDIPAQPIGTIVYYYLAATDINSQMTAVTPIGAELTDPNISNIIMVGYALDKTDDAGDFTTELGSWQAQVPGDNASTGRWINAIPVGSYSTAGDTSTAVQTYYQRTINGEFCWVTGNASSPNDALGTADVDGGHTTLRSAVIDMSGYVNPAISYYRWYLNNPPSGANPNADWWQVSISNDGGTTWTFVENTKTSDRKWRRNAFRVADYVTPTNNMKIRFVASDSLRPGQNLDGGSLVEAAVDDVQIWDNMDPNNVEESGVVDGIQFVLRPNPATDQVLVSFELYEPSPVEVVLMDMAGRIIWNRSFGTVQPGISTQPVNVANVESGVYQVVLRSGGKTLTRKLVIQH